LLVLLACEFLNCLLLRSKILLVLIVFFLKLQGDVVCVVDFVLLEISMILKHVILKLDVSFNLTDVTFCITLSFLLILSYLPLKVFFNALLEGSHILSSFVSHSLELKLKTSALSLLSLKDLFILPICILELS
jgi:hypothetical protein